MPVHAEHLERVLRARSLRRLDVERHVVHRPAKPGRPLIEAEVIGQVLRHLQPTQVVLASIHRHLTHLIYRVQAGRDRCAGPLPAHAHDILHDLDKLTQPVEPLHRCVIYR